MRKNTIKRAQPRERQSKSPGSNKITLIKRLFLLAVGIVACLGIINQINHDHLGKNVQVIGSKDAQIDRVSQSTNVLQPSFKHIEPMKILIQNNSKLNSAMEGTVNALRHHPLFKLGAVERESMKLEEIIEHLHNQESCKDLPIFVSMANVPSDLYWQL